MAKQPLKDSPDNQPAPPGHLAGRDGAAPSSSSCDGAFGERGAARGGAAPRWISAQAIPAGYFRRSREHEPEEPQWPPRPSLCRRCQGVFNTNPWARARSEVCENCAARRHQESASYRDWLGFNRNKGGRIAKGARSPDTIERQLLQTADEFHDLLQLHLLETESLSPKEHWRELSALLIALSGDRLNDRATAKALRFSPKTFHNRDKLGREKFNELIETVTRSAFTQNATYTEVREGEMNATEVREESELVEEKIRVEYEDSIVFLEAFPHETPAQEWERLLLEAA